MSISAKLFCSTYPYFRKLPYFRDIYRAICLGILDQKALDFITLHSYEGNSGFEEYDHNFWGLWPWEIALTESYLNSARDILIAGCGGGREMIALAAAGFDVSGFDCCSELTAVCRKYLQDESFPGKVYDALPNSFPESLGKFDALIIGRGVYHHIVGRKSRIAFLKNCHQHMKQDAPLLIFDFLQKRNNQTYDSALYKVSTGINKLVRNKPPVEMGDKIGNSFYHEFDESELKSELNSAGFDLKIYADSPLSEDTWLSHAVGSAS